MFHWRWVRCQVENTPFFVDLDMTKRQQTYKKNKLAKVGEMLVCPICGEIFKKKQYSQAFCCGQCKDTYWNAKGDRHSPGYYEEYDEKRPERMKRRRLYGSSQICIVGDHLRPRQQDETFTRLLEKKLAMEIYDLD